VQVFTGFALCDGGVRTKSVLHGGKMILRVFYWTVEETFT
jgi:hypothetical protein